MYKKNERKKNREEDLRNQRNYFSIFLSLILNNMTSNCIVNPRKQQQKKRENKNRTSTGLPNFFIALLYIKIGQIYSFSSWSSIDRIFIHGDCSGPTQPEDHKEVRPVVLLRRPAGRHGPAKDDKEELAFPIGLGLGIGESIPISHWLNCHAGKAVLDSDPSKVTWLLPSKLH